MDSEGAAFVTGLVIGLFVAGIVGYASYEAAVNGSQQEAVDKGHAVYDGKTREFTWLPATTAEVP